MATSVPLNIITGRTGTAHVASGDDAAIWRGLVGSANTVLSTGQQLALTDNSAGSLTISDGVFCIAGGHMGRIADSETVTYNLPRENNYRRTFVVIRYANVSNMESMTLMTLQSDPLNDVSPTSSSAASVASAINAAKFLTVETEPSTDYVLYDFVCNADGIVDGTLQTKLTSSDNIPILHYAIETEKTARQSAVSTEAASRQASDNAIIGRLSTLEAYKDSHGSRISALEAYKSSSDNRITSAENVLNECTLRTISLNSHTVDENELLIITLKITNDNKYVTFFVDRDILQYSNNYEGWFVSGEYEANIGRQYYGRESNVNIYHYSVYSVRKRKLQTTSYNITQGLGHGEINITPVTGETTEGVSFTVESALVVKKHTA